MGWREDGREVRGGRAPKRPQGRQRRFQGAREGGKACPGGEGWERHAGRRRERDRTRGVFIRRRIHESYKTETREAVSGPGAAPRGVRGLPTARALAITVSYGLSLYSPGRKARAPFTAWSGPPGCRSRYCLRSPWPSSGGRRQLVWLPGASSWLPASAGPRSPGSAPSPGAPWSAGASLVWGEGPSSPPAQTKRVVRNTQGDSRRCLLLRWAI